MSYAERPTTLLPTEKAQRSALMAAFAFERRQIIRRHQRDRLFLFLAGFAFGVAISAIYVGAPQ